MLLRNWLNITGTILCFEAILDILEQITTWVGACDLLLSPFETSGGRKKGSLLLHHLPLSMPAFAASPILWGNDRTIVEWSDGKRRTWVYWEAVKVDHWRKTVIVSCQCENQCCAALAMSWCHQKKASVPFSQAYTPVALVYACQSFHSADLHLTFHLTECKGWLHTFQFEMGVAYLNRLT